MNHYILLPDHTVRVEPDFMKWAVWFEDFDNRVVKKTILQFHEVSTVFLGLDYGFGSRILLFESMVFSLEFHESPNPFRPGQSMELRDSFDQTRYATWDEAVTGHQELVDRCLALETSSGILARKIVEKSC